MTDHDVRSLYLDLIRGNLTRYGMHERMPAQWTLRRRLYFKTLNRMMVRGGAHRLARATPNEDRSTLVRRKRDLGIDWPAEAETMIGMQRLTSLQRCVETVLAEDIPGDLIECGVWRGGACILMRAVLATYGDETRSVWVADSFEGLPPADPENYKADKGLEDAEPCRASSVYPKLRSRQTSSATDCWTTRSAFFLVGSRTPCTMRRSIASLCCGSMAICSESTIQALEALYPRLSPRASASSMTTTISSRARKRSPTAGRSTGLPPRSST